MEAGKEGMEALDPSADATGEGGGDTRTDETPPKPREKDIMTSPH